MGAAYPGVGKRGSVCPDVGFPYVEVVQEDLFMGKRREIFHRTLGGPWSDYSTG